MQLKKQLWKKSQRAETCRYCGHSHPRQKCSKHVRSGRRMPPELVFLPFHY